jgi:Protein of unknown function (DUF1275)
MSGKPASVEHVRVFTPPASPLPGLATSPVPPPGSSDVDSVGYSSSAYSTDAEDGDRESAAIDRGAAAVNAAAPDAINTEDVTKPPLPKPPVKPIEVTDKGLFKLVILGGVLLCFNGGFINSITLQTKNKVVVSHVSGHATKAAIELGTMNMGDFMNEVALLTFFGMGASVTGYLIGKEKFTLGQSYGRLMVSIGALIFLAMYSGARSSLAVHATERRTVTATLIPWPPRW